MTQYYSRKDYEYAGDSNFTIPFSYISKDDINVYVNDEAITTFTWLNDSQINVTSTLTTGDIISIRRNTPIDEKIVTYHNMSMVLNDDNLNLSQDQILDAVQEIYDNNVTFEIKVNNDIDAIETVANTALTNANTAINTANSAETKADNAVSTANSADSKADNAVSTANTASNNATTAVNTANSAVNTANSASNTATAASNKVDAFGEDISAVIEAAEKIDELEEAVQTAVDAATTAGDKATIASNKATEATNAANRAEAAIPSQTGQNGKFLKTNGTNTSWEEVDALPSQTGQSGKFLTTDGTDASWDSLPIDNSSITENSSDQLQTVGVIDDNSGNTIKTWTGTVVQEEAVTVKDSKTLYYTPETTSIGDIVTDLNGKADVDLTNVNDTGKIAIAHNAMPSNTYIDLTVGASGTTYTAPADGYFYAFGSCSNNGYNDLVIIKGGSIFLNQTRGDISFCDNVYGGLEVSLPVIKNEIVTINWSNATNIHIRFFYAVGSESEAS